MNEPKSTEKPFAIPKRAVVEAFKKVKENQGGPGVDGCTIEEFESELRDRLYVTWNRMSSGSYVPPPVKVVKIPKPHGGGMRMLGADCGDRVAQTVVAMELEKVVEPRFHRSSYGYRPGRSPLDGLRYVGSGVLRTRGCWIVTSPGSLTTFRMISSSRR